MTQDSVLAQINSILQSINTKIVPDERNAEDGLYLGTAGIAYMYYKLSQSSSFQQHSVALLDKAEEYVKPALVVAKKAEHRTKDVPGFVLGICGVYAIASVVYHAKGKESESFMYREMYDKAAGLCLVKDFLRCGGNELFVGRAGYVMGALWMGKETGRGSKASDLYRICDCIVASGKRYSKVHRSAAPLMYSYYDVEYLGAAHGLCSILQVLLI